MKAVDTNILLRYFLNDDEKQNAKVKNLFVENRQNGTCLFVSSLVILELDWVLASFYKMPRDEIIELLLSVVNFDILKVEHEQAIKTALTFAKNNIYDLSDLLIGAIAKANNCTTTLTFDKKASKSPNFELLT